MKTFTMENYVRQEYKYTWEIKMKAIFLEEGNMIWKATKN